MNSNLGTAVLTLKVDDRNFDKSVDRAEKSSGGLGKTLSSVSKIAGGFLAAGVVTAGLDKLTQFAGGAIDAFKESKLASAQLDAVLKSTGNTTGITATQFKDMAASLEKVSLFEDEAIVGAQSMLLTFTNIGGTVMPAATQTVLDMSQALGQDLKSSSIQLGKALNDPINGITALSRVGVSFTEEQKTMIEAMVAAGDTAGAQQLILAELNKEFGGSAKAASDAAGASEVQKDKMNELNEVIGQKLLPIQEKFKEVQVAIITFIIDKVIPAIDQWIQKHPEIVEAINSVVSFISEHWPQIQQVIEMVVTEVGVKIGGMIKTITGIIEVITSVVNTVDALFHGEWASAWESFKEIPAGILKIFEGLLENTFGSIGTTMAKLGSDIIEGMWNGIKAKWKEMTNWIGSAADKLPGFIKGPLGIDSPSRVFHEIGDDIMRGLVEGIAAGNKDVAATLSESIVLVGENVKDFFTWVDETGARMKGDINDLVQFASNVADSLKDAGRFDALNYGVKNQKGTQASPMPGGSGGGVTSGGGSGSGSGGDAAPTPPMTYSNSLSDQSSYVKGKGPSAADLAYLTNPNVRPRINSAFGQVYFSGGAQATAWNGGSEQQPIQVTVNGSILTERDIMSLFRDAAMQGGFRKVEVG